VCLTSLKQQDTVISKVEKDKILCLVGHKRAKVSPHDNMPVRGPSLVKFSLDLLSTLKTYIVTIEGNKE
jgi:hypothetical protein